MILERRLHPPLSFEHARQVAGFPELLEGLTRLTQVFCGPGEVVEAKREEPQLPLEPADALRLALAFREPHPALIPRACAGPLAPGQGHVPQTGGCRNGRFGIRLRLGQRQATLVVACAFVVAAQYEAHTGEPAE